MPRPTAEVSTIDIITWNVNSVRPRLDRTLALLERHQPDVLCLQETKATDDDFPIEPFAERGWTLALHGQKTYNGVAILSRQPLEDVQTGFSADPIPEQARVISARLGDLKIVNLYVVNGKAVGTDKFRLKLQWLDAFQRWLTETQNPDEPLILVGDFNIAPTDRDVHDPERWRGKVLCTDEERERLRRLLDWGLQDLHRLHTDEAGVYTWWDYRMGAFHRGWGLRIDLGLGTPPVADGLRAVAVDREERKKSTGEGSPSDHAPVLFTFDSP